MKIGTKSVLFGAHCFFIHPFFVAAAWCKLYGFPLDPRLWVAFFVHDLGYIGKPNIDGDEGILHPILGAEIMGRLFGEKWKLFTLYHSRALAKKQGARFSKLCVADKFAFCLTPSWLYIPMASATGEIKEYMRLASKGHKQYSDKAEWFKYVDAYMRNWTYLHKGLGEDILTTHVRESINNSGVCK